jgi:hypothetical protein
LREEIAQFALSRAESQITYIQFRTHDDYPLIYR